MYQIEHLLLFFIIALGLFLILLIVLVFLGLFSKEISKSDLKNTLDFLLEQVKNSNNNKEILDSIMNEFYTNFYTISKKNNVFDKWLKFLQEITIIDYMSVEQVANFRDDLSYKNPHIKSEIEQTIGISLKYREKNKHKKS